MPCSSRSAASTCMSRKSRKRPLPPPLKVARAATKRSRSAGERVCAFLRTRTVTGFVPRTAAVPVARASIAASPRATLGRPNSPATKKRTGAPLTGRLSASVGVPRCVRVVANLRPPTGPALRSVTRTAAVPVGLTTRACASTGVHVRKTRPIASAPGMTRSTFIASLPHSSPRTSVVPGYIAPRRKHHPARTRAVPTRSRRLAVQDTRDARSAEIGENRGVGVPRSTHDTHALMLAGPKGRAGRR